MLCYALLARQGKSSYSHAASDSSISFCLDVSHTYFTQMKSPTEATHPIIVLFRLRTNCVNSHQYPTFFTVLLFFYYYQCYNHMYYGLFLLFIIAPILSINLHLHPARRSIGFVSTSNPPRFQAIMTPIAAGLKTSMN